MTQKQTKKALSKEVKTTKKVSKGSEMEAELVNLSFSEIEVYAEKEYNEAKPFLSEYKYSEEVVANAMKRLKMAAILGHIPAQYELAIKYLNPVKEYAELYAEGVLWCKKAAYGGCCDAQNHMGNIYRYGQYGEKVNYELAYDYYMKSAEKGNAHSCLCLGDMYYYGEFVSQNYKKAMMYYLKADERSSSEGDSSAIQAANKIAEMYLNGCIPGDGEKAAYWYRKNALRGSAEASYMLGELYYHGSAGVIVDINESIRWYEMAAKMECPSLSAQLKMAYFYERGIGVKANKKIALEWYKAVAQDENDAFYSFGEMYENVLCYVEKKIMEIATDLGEVSSKEIEF